MHECLLRHLLYVECFSLVFFFLFTFSIFIVFMRNSYRLEIRGFSGKMKNGYFVTITSRYRWTCWYTLSGVPEFVTLTSMTNSLTKMEHAYERCEIVALKNRDSQFGDAACVPSTLFCTITPVPALLARATTLRFNLFNLRWQVPFFSFFPFYRF